MANRRLTGFRMSGYSAVSVSPIGTGVEVRIEWQEGTGQMWRTAVVTMAEAEQLAHDILALVKSPETATP